MRKAKLMLAGIAMFAVVGGTVAVKASKFRQPNPFFHTTVVGGLCTVPLSIRYTTSDAPTTIIPYSTKATLTTYCTTAVVSAI
jgi:hypothetical protein